MPSREEVGPDELLARLVFDPPMFPGGAILFSALFEFPRNECESVIWIRHVDGGLEGVHKTGCERQINARKRQFTTGKIPDKTYIGAATATAGAINNYRNPQGHGVKVVHEPDEGRYHVHLCYDSVSGAAAMTRSDKNEIKLKLVEIFGTLDRHTCPEDGTLG